MQECATMHQNKKRKQGTTYIFKVGTKTSTFNYQHLFYPLDPMGQPPFTHSRRNAQDPPQKPQPTKQPHLPSIIHLYQRERADILLYFCFLV